MTTNRRLDMALKDLIKIKQDHKSTHDKLTKVAKEFTSFQNKAEGQIGDNLYQQLESLESLYRLLRPGLNLPNLRGWALSPDTSLMVVENILHTHPANVLEVGSGASSVLIGLALKKNQRGRLVALENNDRYLRYSNELIKKYRLEHYVKILPAPLRKYRLGNKDWFWYNCELLPKIKFDLVLVDGPPESTQKYARYPAVPLLKPYLNKQVTIILDDADRNDEKWAVSQWLKENQEFSSRYIKSEKGTAWLERSG